MIVYILHKRKLTGAADSAEPKAKQGQVLALLAPKAEPKCRSNRDPEN